MKRILKAIFPPVFLKNVFLIYNAIKIKTVDSFFFPQLQIPPEAFKVSKTRNPFLFWKVPVKDYPRIVQEKLNIWLDPEWFQDEYFLDYQGKGFIEPLVGWGMTKKKELIYPSLGFSYANYVHRPGIVKSYFLKKRISTLEAIISLRDTGEENYFHFFNDVIAKLLFVRDQGYDIGEFKVIISQKLYEKEYFQKMMNSGLFRAIDWHVQQTDEWIEFERAIFCKPFTHTREYFLEMSNLFSNVLGKSGDRRIFLTRNPSSLRFIENIKDLSPVLTKYGFEVVDSGSLSFTEQVNLFSECRFLIGIHGAGLTNMIFRAGKPITVIEIAHPFKYIPFHYMMLAAQNNIKHQLLLGTKGKRAGAGGFIVDPCELERIMISTFEGI